MKTIVVILRSTSTDMAKRMRQGVMDLTHQGGYVVAWKAPQSESDYTQQANVVREATEQHVAGIVLVPDHQLVLASSVQHAKDLGIPVVINQEAKFHCSRFMETLGTRPGLS
jgi:ABC-type sugar transport system substrate-binding protein